MSLIAWQMVWSTLDTDCDCHLHVFFLSLMGFMSKSISFGSSGQTTLMVVSPHAAVVKCEMARHTVCMIPKKTQLLPNGLLVYPVLVRTDLKI